MTVGVAGSAYVPTNTQITYNISGTYDFAIMDAGTFSTGNAPSTYTYSNPSEDNILFYYNNFANTSTFTINAVVPAVKALVGIPQLTEGQSSIDYPFATQGIEPGTQLTLTFSGAENDLNSDTFTATVIADPNGVSGQGLVTFTGISAVSDAIYETNNEFFAGVLSSSTVSAYPTFGVGPTIGVNIVADVAPPVPSVDAGPGFTVNEGVTFDYTVTTNALVPDGTELTITLPTGLGLSAPTTATVSSQSATFTFTTTANEILNDAEETSGTCTVSGTVNGTNFSDTFTATVVDSSFYRVPVASSITENSNQNVTVNLSDEGSEGELFYYKVPYVDRNKLDDVLTDLEYPGNINPDTYGDVQSSATFATPARGVTYSYGAFRKITYHDNQIYYFNSNFLNYKLDYVAPDFPESVYYPDSTIDRFTSSFRVEYFVVNTIQTIYAYRNVETQTITNVDLSFDSSTGRHYFVVPLDLGESITIDLLAAKTITFGGSGVYEEFGEQFTVTRQLQLVGDPQFTLTIGDEQVRTEQIDVLVNADYDTGISGYSEEDDAFIEFRLQNLSTLEYGDWQTSRQFFVQRGAAYRVHARNSQQRESSQDTGYIDYALPTAPIFFDPFTVGFGDTTHEFRFVGDEETFYYVFDTETDATNGTNIKGFGYGNPNNSIKVITVEGGGSNDPDVLLTYYVRNMLDIQYGGTGEFGSQIFSYTVETSIDVLPDEFDFEDKFSQELDFDVYSNTITLTGFNFTTVESITGGDYRINGGAWITESFHEANYAANINASARPKIYSGGTLQLRVRTANAFDTGKQVIVQLGYQSGINRVQGSFIARTKLEDLVAPTISAVNTTAFPAIGGGVVWYATPEFSVQGQGGQQQLALLDITNQNAPFTADSWTFSTFFKYLQPGRNYKIQARTYRAERTYNTPGETTIFPAEVAYGNVFEFSYEGIKPSPITAIEVTEGIPEGKTSLPYNAESFVVTCTHSSPYTEVILSSSEEELLPASSGSGYGGQEVTVTRDLGYFPQAGDSNIYYVWSRRSPETGGTGDFISTDVAILVSRELVYAITTDQPSITSGDTVTVTFIGKDNEELSWRVLAGTSIADSTDISDQFSNYSPFITLDNFGVATATLEFLSGIEVVDQVLLIAAKNSENVDKASVSINSYDPFDDQEEEVRIIGLDTVLRNGLGYYYTLNLSENAPAGVTYRYFTEWVIPGIEREDGTVYYPNPILYPKENSAGESATFATLDAARVRSGYSPIDLDFYGTGTVFLEIDNDTAEQFNLDAVISLVIQRKRQEEIQWETVTSKDITVDTDETYILLAYGEDVEEGQQSVEVYFLGSELEETWNWKIVHETTEDSNFEEMQGAVQLSPSNIKAGNSKGRLFYTVNSTEPLSYYIEVSDSLGIKTKRTQLITAYPKDEVLVGKTSPYLIINEALPFPTLPRQITGTTTTEIPSIDFIASGAAEYLIYDYYLKVEDNSTGVFLPSNDFIIPSAFLNGEQEGTFALDEFERQFGDVSNVRLIENFDASSIPVHFPTYRISLVGIRKTNQEERTFDSLIFQYNFAPYYNLTMPTSIEEGSIVSLTDISVTNIWPSEGPLYKNLYWKVDPVTDQVQLPLTNLITESEGYFTAYATKEWRFRARPIELFGTYSIPFYIGNISYTVKFYETADYSTPPVAEEAIVVEDNTPFREFSIYLDSTLGSVQENQVFSTSISVAGWGASFSTLAWKIVDVSSGQTIFPTSDNFEETEGTLNFTGDKFTSTFLTSDEQLVIKPLEDETRPIDPVTRLRSGSYYLVLTSNTGEEKKIPFTVRGSAAYPKATFSSDTPTIVDYSQSYNYTLNTENLLDSDTLRFKLVNERTEATYTSSQLSRTSDQVTFSIDYTFISANSQVLLNVESTISIYILLNDFTELTKLELTPSLTPEISASFRQIVEEEASSEVSVIARRYSGTTLYWQIKTISGGEALDFSATSGTISFSSNTLLTKTSSLYITPLSDGLEEERPYYKLSIYYDNAYSDLAYETSFSVKNTDNIETPITYTILEEPSNVEPSSGEFYTYIISAEDAPSSLALYGSLINQSTNQVVLQLEGAKEIQETGIVNYSFTVPSEYYPATTSSIFIISEDNPASTPAESIISLSTNYQAPSTALYFTAWNGAEIEEGQDINLELSAYNYSFETVNWYITDSPSVLNTTTDAFSPDTSGSISLTTVSESVKTGSLTFQKINNNDIISEGKNYYLKIISENNEQLKQERFLIKPVGAISPAAPQYTILDFPKNVFVGESYTAEVRATYNRDIYGDINVNYEIFSQSQQLVIDSGSFIPRTSSEIVFEANINISNTIYNSSDTYTLSIITSDGQSFTKDFSVSIPGQVSDNYSVSLLAPKRLEENGGVSEVKVFTQGFSPGDTIELEIIPPANSILEIDDTSDTAPGSIYTSSNPYRIEYTPVQRASYNLVGDPILIIPTFNIRALNNNVDNTAETREGTIRVKGGNILPGEVLTSKTFIVEDETIERYQIVAPNEVVAGEVNTISIITTNVPVGSVLTFKFVQLTGITLSSSKINIPEGSLFSEDEATTLAFEISTGQITERESIYFQVFKDGQLLQEERIILNPETIPSYFITGPDLVEEGTSPEFVVTSKNSDLTTLYWDFGRDANGNIINNASSDFFPLAGSISLNAQGEGTFTFSVTRDAITEADQRYTIYLRENTQDPAVQTITFKHRDVPVADINVIPVLGVNSVTLTSDSANQYDRSSVQRVVAFNASAGENYYLSTSNRQNDQKGKGRSVGGSVAFAWQEDSMPPVDGRRAYYLFDDTGYLGSYYTAFRPKTNVSLDKDFISISSSKTTGVTLTLYGKGSNTTYEVRYGTQRVVGANGTTFTVPRNDLPAQGKTRFYEIYAKHKYGGDWVSTQKGFRVYRETFQSTVQGPQNLGNRFGLLIKNANSNTIIDENSSVLFTLVSDSIRVSKEGNTTQVYEQIKGLPSSNLFFIAYQDVEQLPFGYNVYAETVYDTEQQIMVATGNVTARYTDYGSGPPTITSYFQVVSVGVD